MKPLSNAEICLESVIPEHCIGKRVDQVAASLFSTFSRAQLQQWIKGQQLTLNGQPCKPKDRVVGGEQIVVKAHLVSQGDWLAENIAIDVIYEDPSLLVVNKPAGLVVHPGAGNSSGTLLNGLLYHYPEQQKIPRAGIVHRLDKDTSGLMVVARTLQAQTSLVEQLQARTVSREYEAIVHGVPIAGGQIDEPIGRHPRIRTRMAVVAQGGKEAMSQYRVLQKFEEHAHLRVKLSSGRTHQIRVHMTHVGFPLVGDPVYSGRSALPATASDSLKACLGAFKRQALHAASLQFLHPESGELLNWDQPLPADFSAVLAALIAG